MVPSSDAVAGSPLVPASSRVLLVEDEFLIRIMLGEELRNAGYQVIEASDASEALAVLNTVASDLIISDVRMPGPLDGLDLLVQVREAWPRLPVIIMSGHLSASEALAKGATGFIAKPYLLDAVIDASREALGDPR